MSFRNKNIPPFQKRIVISLRKLCSWALSLPLFNWRSNGSALLQQGYPYVDYLKIKPEVSIYRRRKGRRFELGLSLPHFLNEDYASWGLYQGKLDELLHAVLDNAHLLRRKPHLIQLYGSLYAHT